MRSNIWSGESNSGGSLPENMQLHGQRHSLIILPYRQEQSIKHVFRARLN